jgi:hypothetical protein
MMTENINEIFEIKPQLKPVLNEDVKRTTCLVRISFCLGLSLVLMATISSLISQYVIYNPPLTALNGTLIYLILFLAPLSVLLSVVGLIRIIFRRKNLRGCTLSVISILISIGSLVACIYFVLINMSWA